VKHYDFVIIGAGSTGRTAVETLSREGRGQSILLINGEGLLPYKRTQVSKRVAVGFQPNDFAIHDKAWYDENGVDLLTGAVVSHIDSEAHTLFLDSVSFSYSRLLLAIGGRPSVPFSDLPGGKWSALWTVQDGILLNKQFSKIKKLVVVGTGVLGVEAAWQSSQAGVDTVLVGLDEWPMRRLLDRSSAAQLEHSIRESSLSLMLERNVIDVIDGLDNQGVLVKTDKETIEADYAVLAVGGEAEVSLARNSGIPVNRGILVDSGLKTSVGDIWAAGDCAEHPSGLITGLWHSAENQGYLAALGILGMLGQSVKFENPPYRLKCEVFGGYWFSAGPVNTPVESGGIGPAEIVESGGIFWRPRFRDEKLAALSAAAPSGMEKKTAKAAQKLMLNNASREETYSVLKG